MKGQSIKSSLIEQVLNVGSGWLLSILVWTYFIVPVFQFNSGLQENLLITSIFTLVSVVRGFLWRRYFNKLTYQHKEKIK